MEMYLIIAKPLESNFHIEVSQLNCSANQFTCFYVTVTLDLN